jgi:hypothetical protein
MSASGIALRQPSSAMLAANRVTSQVKCPTYASSKSLTSKISMPSPSM